MPPDWSKLIDHLDSHRTNLVRLDIKKIGRLVGELPPTASTEPQAREALGYWRTTHVLSHLKPANWTTDLVDYRAKAVLFRRLRDDDDRPLQEATGWVNELRHLVAEACALGNVTNVVASTTLENGTKVKLNVEVGENYLLERHRGKAPHASVSPGRPIRRLASSLARKGTVIEFDDPRPLRWRVPDDWITAMSSPAKIKESYRHFKDEIRQRVLGIEVGRGLGGYGCLATMSRKKSKQTGQIAAYSPAALGLYRTDDDDGLYNLVLQDKLVLVLIQGISHDEPDAIRIQVRNPTAEEIELRIPAGTIFEQETAPDVQDLVVKEMLVEKVAPGKTKDIQMYGLCMDKDGASPNGEALLLTPWVLATDVDNQADLWKVTEGE